MSLAILHPAFDAIGGASFTAVRQARFFQSLGADVRIRTLAYDGVAWDGPVGTVRVDAYAHVRTNGAEHEVSSDVNSRAVEWALDGIESNDVIVAHNFPVSAAVGLSRRGALKIWYCHEPARFLHPRGANPTLWLKIQSPRSVRHHAVRFFLRWIVLPSLASPSRRSRAREDRAGVSGIDEIWANSEFTRDNVHRVFGRRAVEVVHPLIEFRKAPPRRSGINREPLSVLVVSRLERHKNLDTLFGGFARFLRSRRAVLHVVGRGTAGPELERLSQSLGIGESVVFHGFLADAALDELAAACDVFAFFPVDEPFGMVFPEAASQGLLLLGPDHGGPLEILDHGRLGQVADAFDVDAVAEALERIWRMTDTEVDRLRECAAEACRARYSVEVVGAKMKALLARRGVEFSNGR